MVKHESTMIEHQLTINFPSGVGSSPAMATDIAPVVGPRARHFGARDAPRCPRSACYASGSCRASSAGDGEGTEVGGDWLVHVG